MNARVRIPSYIEALTGISDAMVRKAPMAAAVMHEVFEFVGNYPLVAHNASFERAFWDAELSHINRTRQQEFACSMLLSRRVFPQAPSHKLGVLVEFDGLPVAGRYHRALADAEMAAILLAKLVEELRNRYNVSKVSHELLRKIQYVAKHRLNQCLEQHC